MLDYGVILTLFFHLFSNEMRFVFGSFHRVSHNQRSRYTLLVIEMGGIFFLCIK